MGNDNQNNSSQSNEIINLKNELNKANKIIKQQKLTINELQNQLNNYNLNITNYQTIINQKDIQINTLISQLNNQQLNNNKAHDKISNNSIHKNIDFNDVLFVNFISSDQNVHYAAACLKTDTFAEIEEKLYKQYPQYRETNNNFIANGREVLRFKTIDDNKIGNGLPVTLIVPA